MYKCVCVCFRMQMYTRIYKCVYMFIVIYNHKRALKLKIYKHINIYKCIYLYSYMYTRDIYV